MKKVLLRAPLLTNSGYGVHSRQIFEWLHEKNIDLTVECLNWGQTPWLLNADACNGLVGKIMSKSKKVEPPYDLTIQVQLPDEWDPNLGKFNVGISAFVETDRCNPVWIECCNKMDQIIVPSKFTERLVKASGRLETPISVVHEWFNHDILKDKHDIEYNFKSNFNFFFIGQITGQSYENDRKNIFNTIKWTLEEFKNIKNVGLVMKINGGRGSYEDREKTINSIKQIIKEVNSKKRIPVELIHGNMTQLEIANLYKQKNISCYISATRGEGYGLPLVDAAAAGIPVVATNWSGHLDFLKNKFYKVDYKIKKISSQKIDNRIFLEDFSWAEPDELSFKKKIKEVYNNQQKSQKIAEELKSNVIKEFSKEKIKFDYDTIIKI